MDQRSRTNGKTITYAEVVLVTMLLMLLTTGPAMAAETVVVGPCDDDPASSVCVGHTSCGENTVYLSVDTPVAGWKQCVSSPSRFAGT